MVTLGLRAGLALSLLIDPVIKTGTVSVIVSIMLDNPKFFGAHLAISTA